MSYEPSFEQRTDAVVNRLGELTAKLRFDELVEYATEVCLRKPPDYDAPPTKESGKDRDVVLYLGLRGLRSAVELAEKYISAPPSPEEENDEDEDEDETAEEYEDEDDKPKSFRVDYTSPMLYPETWSTQLDPDIINKATKFGESLIAEAYAVLGHDVYQKIEELKSAQTVKDQMDIIMWLDRRIHKMTRDPKADQESDESEEKHFYHPMRLSPKLIGTYPNHALRPTCLSVSIIADSFFEKAGLKTLHAGVNESGSEKTIGAGIFLAMKTLSSFEERYNIKFADPALAAIKNVAKRLITTHKREDAQHSAIYVQLIDGNWAQFDPNYLATFAVQEESANEQLTKTDQILNEFEDIAPGLEISTMLLGSMPAAEILENIFDEQRPEYLAAHAVKAREILTSLGNESIPQAIYEQCFLPFFNTSTDNDYLALLLDAANSARIFSEYTDKPELEIQEKFYEMFERYVLWGDSLENFLRRVREDSEYLNNRIEDIVALPFMVAISIAKSEAEEGTPSYTHHKLDIGLPAPRIGFSALSDFAAYDDESELPNSFWISYWPGNASVISHIFKEPFSDSDRILTRANAISYHMHPFTSTKNYEIIKSFLEANREE